MRTLFTVGAIAIGIAGFAAHGIAQSPEEQVEFRQSQMKIFGGGARTIGNFIKGEGSVADVQQAAAAMDEVQQRLPDLFPEGTAVGVGDSEALPVIWENWDEFTETVKEAQVAIAALNDAAQTGDAEQIRAAFGPAGQACGSCHENYRAD